MLLWEFSVLSRVESSKPGRHLVVEAGSVVHVVAQVLEAELRLSSQGRGAPVTHSLESHLGAVARPALWYFTLPIYHMFDITLPLPRFLCIFISHDDMSRRWCQSLLCHNFICKKHHWGVTSFFLNCSLSLNHLDLNWCWITSQQQQQQHNSTTFNITSCHPQQPSPLFVLLFCLRFLW